MVEWQISALGEARQLSFTGNQVSLIRNNKPQLNAIIEHRGATATILPSGNTELIFFPTISNNDFVPAPEASGIHATDLKTINVEFLYEDGTCQRYELKWENRQNAYILGDQGRGKCFIKTVR